MKNIILILMLLGTVVYAKSGMSMSTFKKLQKIEDLSVSKEPQKAQEKLEEFLNKPPSRKIDKGYLFYTAGMFYLQKDDYEKTYKYILDAYNLDVMPEKTKLYMLQLLAGLNIQDAKYKEAITYYRLYNRLSKEPNKNIYTGLASAYYNNKDYKNAVSTLTKSIKLFEARKSNYLMLFGSYYNLKKLKDATTTLEKMVRLWPSEKSYWMKLIHIYIERKDYDKSLEVLQLANKQNILLKQRDILQYVYILYEKDLPLKAAELLKNAINTQKVKKNLKHYELLSTLYQESKENKKAIESLKSASDYCKDGKNDLYIAQLYYEEENKYEEVIKYINQALEKGIEKKGSAYMLIAVAYSELGEIENSKKYLKEALKYPKTKKTAKEWLKSL